VDFKIVVCRQAPAGGEVLLRRVGQTWSLPAGASRLGESPRQAAERYLQRERGIDVAVVELESGEDAEAVFAGEAEAEDSGVFVPRQAGEAWFGLGKVRALALGADGHLVERVICAIE
jgi:ADP-ribose pyrophosphatase YjhB (NUDIX family)